jgi:DNA-binding transcriptional LysR family regulator
MNLRHARTFVTVADLGTVSKAALHLHVAQPALSRQINDLEQELGVKLFDRVGRGLLLTSVGEQLLGECRNLLSCADAVGERAHLLRKGDSGVLRIAASPQHIESVLSQLLRRYAQSYPNVEVDVREGSGHEILAMLERGHIHLAQNLLHELQVDNERYGVCSLGRVELLAASHADLKRGKGRMIEIHHLVEHPLLLLDSGFGFRRAFDAACRVAGVAPRVRFESRAPHTLLALAEAGHGVAIVPSAQRTHRYELLIFGVTYRRKSLSEPLCILWDQRRSLPRYATAFREMWVEYVREVFPITRPTAVHKAIR